MKKLFLMASIAFATMSLSSCYTTTMNAVIPGDGTVKTAKVAHGSAGVFAGIIGNKSNMNSVENVAAKAGITKVSRVEYSTKSYVGGLYTVFTTTVYGE